MSTPGTNLSEQIKVRVDRATKAELGIETKRQQRSEGAIVRIALREYLTNLAKQRRKGKAARDV